MAFRAMTVFRGRADLLRQFRDGDRVALETVYRTYVHKVTAIVRHGLRLPARAAGARGPGLGDLVQDIFLRAFAPSARMGFDGLRDYGPYLAALARNTMVDWARREGREIPTDFPEMESLTNATAAEPPVDDGLDPDVRKVVETYLAGLDSELRAVHEVRYQRGLSQQEGAETLGITRQSLRTLENRLRTGLRKALMHHELGRRI
jgi:RNA polymerase sigma-70 factor (ECF subfamily)